MCDQIYIYIISHEITENYELQSTFIKLCLRLPRLDDGKIDLEIKSYAR